MPLGTRNPGNAKVFYKIEEIKVVSKLSCMNY